MRHIGLQTLRRLVQASVMLVLSSVVFLSLYAHYRAARALDDEQLMGGAKGKILAAIHRRVDGMDDPQAFLDGCKGTIWSMRLAGLDVSDPLAAAEMLAASKTVYVPMLLSIVTPVIVTLVLGKVFCGWMCPAYVLFEVAGKLRKVLRFAELPPPDVRFSHKNKYLVLICGLVVAVLLGQPLFALVYPPAVLSRVVHAWIFGSALTGMVTLLGLIIVFEVVVSPRWWCRTMCPGGALYGLIGWPRVLRVKLDAARCTRCGECLPVCEAGINPIVQSCGIECDNCGKCVRHCPERALRYTLSLPARREGTSITEPKQRSRSAAVLLCGVALLALPPNPAYAHHILGLPHYSYKENYPQVPTLEYPATTGPYDVLLTSYPGKPTPAEPANLAFYIKHRATGVPYDKPITVRAVQTYTFGRNREVVPATVVQPFEQPQKLTVTFPQAGEYVVELTMDVEGQPELVPFMMVAGEPSATVSVVVAIVLSLAVFVIAVRAIKIKRSRRLKAATVAA